MLQKRVKERYGVLPRLAFCPVFELTGAFGGQTDRITVVRHAEAAADRERAAGKLPEGGADAETRLQRVVPCADEENVVAARLNDRDGQRPLTTVFSGENVVDVALEKQ